MDMSFAAVGRKNDLFDPASFESVCQVALAWMNILSETF